MYCMHFSYAGSKKSKSKSLDRYLPASGGTGIMDESTVDNEDERRGL